MHFFGIIVLFYVDAIWCTCQIFYVNVEDNFVSSEMPFQKNYSK